MLKTIQILRKTFLFNTFIGIFLILGLPNALAQNSVHGAGFDLNKNIETDTAFFKTVKSTDSIHTQVKGIITDVCQAKGCWMKVNLADGEEVFVRFKDYGFFVPTDVAGKEVIINGAAFVEEMSVKDQRHYAKDKGASQKEVDAITTPQRTFRFEADGVRISGQ